jgi:hypothetical protein
MNQNILTCLTLSMVIAIMSPAIADEGCCNGVPYNTFQANCCYGVIYNGPNNTCCTPAQVQQYTSDYQKCTSDAKAARDKSDADAKAGYDKAKATVEQVTQTAIAECVANLGDAFTEFCTIGETSVGDTMDEGASAIYDALLVSDGAIYAETLAGCTASVFSHGCENLTQ